MSASCSSLQLPLLKNLPTNSSVHSLPMKEKLRNKSSLLGAITSSSDNNIDIDVIKSLEKNPLRERALYAAMDTTIAAAMNPYISQMILMQHNDVKTRRTKAFAQSDKRHKDNTASGTSLLLASMHGDCVNNEHLYSTKKRSSFSNSLTLSEIMPSLSNSELYLHPNSCNTSNRKFGIATCSFDSGSSISSEDARLVQVKGKLLSGDDVNYEYVAVSTNMDGKETVVLHTDHPKPKFVKDYTISEENSVNSATGLYRTLVGPVPNVLNVSKPTGILLLDRQDSIDSGNANDDPSGSISPGVKTEDKLLNNQGSSLPDKLNPKVTGKSFTKAMSDDSGNKMRMLNNQNNISFSFSPSFDEIDKRTSQPYIDSIEPDVKQEYGSDDVAIKNKSDIVSCSLKDRTTRNSVNVVPKSNLKQVVINQSKRTITKEVSSQTCVDDNEATGSKQKPVVVKSKANISGWLSRHLWSSKDSTSSLRSLSTDSGYKQSISIDECTQAAAKNSFCNPTDEIRHDNYATTRNGDSKSNAIMGTPSGVMGTTVVTIENDKFRKLRSIDSHAKKNATDKISHSLSLDLSVSDSNHCGFDPNKTVSMESNSNLSTIPQLPTFYSTSTIEDSETALPRSISDICDEYVILDDNGDAKDSEKKGDTVGMQDEYSDTPTVSKLCSPDRESVSIK